MPLEAISRAFRTWLCEFCYPFPPRRERLRSHSFFFSSLFLPSTNSIGYSSCAVRVLVFLWLDNSFLQFLRDRFYGPHRSAERPLSTTGRRTRLCRRVPLEGLVFLREIARVEGAQKSGGEEKVAYVRLSNIVQPFSPSSRWCFKMEDVWIPFIYEWIYFELET